APLGEVAQADVAEGGHEALVADGPAVDRGEAVGDGRVGLGGHEEAARLGAIVAGQTARDEQEGGEALQNPPSTPMLGMVTGPISFPLTVSVLRVALSISITSEIHPVSAIRQRFSTRTSSR